MLGKPRTWKPAWRNWRRAATGSWTPPRRSGSASSATCTTGRSSGSSRWRSNGPAKAKFGDDVEAAAELVDRAHSEAKAALIELRDLVRGVHRRC